jgi:flagellar assembly factor FliW
MKKTIMTRFGEVEYDPANTVLFAEGLIGFENLRDFIVMPNRKNGPLFWIQSVDDPDIAFVLTDPTNFFLDYKVVPDRRERIKLGIEDGDECHALAVVTVPPDRKVTLNLMAPILFAPSTNRAIQVALENSQYKTREPLPT